MSRSTFTPNPADDELVREALERNPRADIFQLSHIIDEIREQRATVTPQALKRRLDLHDVQIAQLSKQGREKNQAATESIQNVDVRVVTAINNLTAKIGKLEAQGREKDAKIDDLSDQVSVLTTSIEETKKTTWAQGQTLTNVDETVFKLTARLDDLDKKLFGDEIPPLEYERLPQMQGSFVFDLTKYKPLGRIWNLQHLKDVLGARGDYQLHIYDEKVGVSALATLKLKSLSLHQRLMLSEFVSHDTDRLAPEYRPTDSKEKKN